MITGIQFGSFVAGPKPQAPVAQFTGYQTAPTTTVIPVHPQPVNLDLEPG